MMRRIAVAAVAVTALSGCANMETQPDEQGIRYSGGMIFPEAIEFQKCQGPSRQEYGSPGDRTFAYPAGQRTFKFSADAGADSTPLQSSAPSPGGGQPIVFDVSGTVTFTPNFGDCAALQRFHETIGLKFEAHTPEGWRQVLSVYIKDVVDRAVDNEALKFDWVALTSNADAKAAWEAAVAAALPDLVKKQSGGDFFTVNSVLLQRPDLPENVDRAIADTEAARQQAQTAEQFKAAAATFPGGPTAYQAFLTQQAVNKAIETGQVKVIPIPQGSSVIVQGQ